MRPDSGEGGTVGDHALVERMAAGDEHAVRAFVDRHGDSMYALARSILHEHEDAQEIAEDAFLQAWRSAPTFDPARGSVLAWLATIVRTRALDRLRARKRHGLKLQRLAEPILHGGGNIVRPADSPDRRVEAMEARTLVGQAMDDLPEAQRTVIELAYFSGLSQTEIATHLGVPLGTVKTRTLTALRRLRGLLAPLLREGAA